MATTHGHYTTIHVKSKVLKTVKMLLWAVTRCGLAGIQSYQRSGEKTVHYTHKMETVCFSETMVSTYTSTRHDRFLPNPFQLIVYVSSAHSTLYSLSHWKTSLNELQRSSRSLCKRTFINSSCTCMHVDHSTVAVAACSRELRWKSSRDLTEMSTLFMTPVHNVRHQVLTVILSFFSHHSSIWATTT
jgi:hypothetical protein